VLVESKDRANRRLYAGGRKKMRVDAAPGCGRLEPDQACNRPAVGMASLLR
jgi:hypothetical protein